MARDRRYELDASGVMYRVLTCAECGMTVRFPRRAPMPEGAAVYCATCRGRR